MQGTTREFGTMSNGALVTEYTLTADNGSVFSAITYGATWRRLAVKDGDELSELVLNFDNVADYETNPFHLGNTIGPVGGRIMNGEFAMDGDKVHVTPNEGQNVLHGGLKGMDRVNYEAEMQVGDGVGTITFTHRFDDTGFPGPIDMSVVYQFDELNGVTIVYTGNSEQATLFNPMTHVYLNARGNDSSILDQTLLVRALDHVTVDDQKLPTGLETVAQTPYDFRKAQHLAPALAQIPGGQLDDAFEVAPNEPAVILKDPASNRSIAVMSDRNGAVIFTANPYVIGHPDSWLDEHPFNGVAVEMQILPDAPHHPEFGSIVLPAHTIKTYTTKYQVLD